VRQRLSSEPDRYRGRRRVPTPPRSRYAVVVTSAFVGAGIVALGAANLPDAKAVSPSVLADLESASITANGLSARSADTDRASRSEERGAEVLDAPTEVAEADIWMLPLDDYTFTSPFGVRFGELHAGIDLAAPEGTPYKAVHAGIVKKAGYDGGFGYSITIEHPDGTQTVYGHSRRLLVQAGQQVTAGQVIGEVGNTGHSFGTHLHLGVYIDGDPVDPIPTLLAHGVDIKLQVETVYSNNLAS
jgi:murein DD-endopeptidase MepM/ murein hydrolase activator NlpD